ncbi:MAG: dihydrofolate reductase [Chloroflexi bacterium]|nr:dihydrofolate reductase [Chloroflexota bacterium]
MLNRVSIDGFFCGPNGAIDWFIHDPAVDRAAHEMMSPDTLLLGRLTYDMFFGYWPHVAKDPDAPEGARVLANELSRMNKVVFSQTMNAVGWENSRLVHGAAAGEVRSLKQAQGADITIFGSGTIVQQLASERLIDEYLIIVTPVVVGTGKPLFHNVGRFDLSLLETRRFASGNVLLHYRAGAPAA